MSDAAPEPKDNMGQPVPRYDAHDKVTGRAHYPSDTPLDRPAYAFLATSGIAKGSITALDDADARAVPGVLEIFTYRNTGGLKQTKFGGGSSTSIQSLGPEIQHDGQIVAMAVAETFEAAREAAYRLKIEYRAAQPTAGFDDDGAQTEAVKGEWLRTGDVDAALQSAAAVIDQHYSTPTQHHNAIELFATTCVWNGDQLTVYEPSQFVYGLRNGVANRLGIDPERVNVVSPYVGGAFGSKSSTTPRTGLVAYAARQLGRPVKLVATRDQGFTVSSYRAETRHHIRLGARPDGKIVAYDHEGWELTSRPDAYSVKGNQETAHLYDFGAVRTKVNVVHADRNTPGFMRSPPVVPYVYALESAMDELAVELNMDPVELRRANDGPRDSFGKAWTSRSLMACYDAASQAFGWSKRDSRPGSMRDGDWLIGWGCATAVYPTHVAAAAARVRLRSTGEVLVQTSAQDLGTGAYTVIGQMASDELGVPVEKVRVEIGRTGLPPSPMAGGSVLTASACSAVMKACQAINARLDGVAPSGAAVGAPGQAASSRPASAGTDHLAQRFRALGTSVIEEYAENLPPGVPADAIDRLYRGMASRIGGGTGEKLMYAHGAEFVEVRVHAQTREIRCPRAVGAFAAGRIMNTRTAHSQLMGGMIWGISSALHEATDIDGTRARYVNDNLADYLVPVNADIRDIDVILIPERDDEVNIAGIKGLGELGNVGTAAAIANAVYHATGIRIRDLPVRIEKLLQA